MTLALKLHFDSFDSSDVSFEHGYDTRDLQRRYGSNVDPIDDSHIQVETMGDTEYWVNYLL